MTNPGDAALPLDVNRMRVLAAAIDAGSVSAAAASLGVTPSAVSQQLNALERDAGVALVERTRTGVRATAQGERLAARSREIADLLVQARAELHGDSVTGRVTVSAVASACVSFVSPAATSLSLSHPELVMTVHSTEPTESIVAVSAGRVDIAVVDEYDQVPLALPDDLITRRISEDRLVAVGARGRFGADASIRLASLKHARWVMPPAAAACGQAVRTACRAAGFEPDVRWETDDLMVLEHAVAGGHGVAVLPQLAVCASVSALDVVAVQRPALRRRLIAVVRRSAAARPSVRVALEAIAEHAR